MGIYSLTGYIEELAPKYSQVLALWALNNWTGRQSIWQHSLPEYGVKVKNINPISGKTIEGKQFLTYLPWHEGTDTLWKLFPNPIGKLEYIYVFSNPNDMPNLERFIDIDTLIFRCLDTLKTEAIKSVSLLLIPASESPVHECSFDGKFYGHKKETDDIESASRMVSAIENWISLNNYDIDVYLVDRLGDFDLVLKK